MSPRIFRGLGKYAVILMCISVLSCPSNAQTSYVPVKLYPVAPVAYSVDVVGPYHMVAPGGQLVGYDLLNTPTNHAEPVMWTANGAYVDLFPTNLAGYFEAGINATDGISQVGWTTPGGTSLRHAILWHSAGNTAVDLNPTGFSESEAYYVNGTQQVGGGFGSRTKNNGHALVWNGNAASAVDLNPIGYDTSNAFGTDGTRQVGVGLATGYYGTGHALMWTGSAQSVVDLAPTNISGFRYTYAISVHGNQIVGKGDGYIYNSQTHALLWYGTADSCVDLNPIGFSESFGTDTNGIQQVGYGTSVLGVGGGTHALLWSGNASSFVDLGKTVPSGIYYSAAYSIDSSGNVFGIGYGGNGYYALEWVPTPEPSSIALIGMIISALLIRPKNGRRTGRSRQLT